MSTPQWLLDLPRPEFMAIGDSLLNGMRSYTIDDAKAASSIPALLGGVLHAHPGFAPFVRAHYPQSILIDVEGEVARFASVEQPVIALFQILSALDQIKADVAANARSWLNRFEAGPVGDGPAAFDNLAIAGARIEDAFTLTYAQLQARINAMAPVLRAGNDPLRWSGSLPPGDPAGPGSWSIGDVHISFNARHLRNPANRDGLGSLTVVDTVGARRPKVLLADMGANHGLVDVVMRGQGDAGMDGLRAFAAAWPPCARALARLPGVETVIMLLLPRPSQVPCLAPPNPSPGPDLEPPPTRPDGYFDRYVSAIDPISSGFGYDGDTVARLDREMDAVNAEVRASTTQAFAGSGKQLLFASLADMLGRHDFKQRRGPMLSGGASGRAYSNYSLGRIFRIGADRLRGGICGLDQIHPTTIGYRYVAEELRRMLSAQPGAPSSDPIPVTDAGDPFLLSPHWATIAVLDALYPRAPTLDVSGGMAAIADASKQDADRLMFRPGWLR